MNGSETNLHKFWDSGAFLIQNDSYVFDRPLTPSKMNELKNNAKQLIRNFGNQVEKEAQNVDPVEWAIGSLIAAKEIVYPHFMKNKDVDERYTR